MSCNGFFILNSFKTGTNACIKAPSANNLLKKLGILKATKKASVLAEAPKIFANAISLMKPEILDIKVMLPTTNEDLSNEFGLFLLIWVLIHIYLIDRQSLHWDNLVLFYLLNGENTLANTSQARKRVRQAQKARIRNASQKSNFRTSIKKVLKSLTEKNKDQSNANFKEATSVIDKLVMKGLIHKNKAARHKSRLNKKIQKLS